MCLSDYKVYYVKWDLSNLFQDINFESFFYKERERQRERETERERRKVEY